MKEESNRYAALSETLYACSRFGCVREQRASNELSSVCSSSCGFKLA